MSIEAADLIQEVEERWEKGGRPTDPTGHIEKVMLAHKLYKNIDTVLYSELCDLFTERRRAAFEARHGAVPITPPPVREVLIKTASRVVTPPKAFTSEKLLKRPPKPKDRWDVMYRGVAKFLEREEAKKRRR
jgi:hypothetical protein